VPSSICPWAIADPRFGYEGAEIRRHLLDVLHTVMDEKACPSRSNSRRIASAIGPLVCFADIGEDRLTSSRRRVDHREVPDSGQPISSVRGIGLAVRVRTSTPIFQLLHRFFVVDTEPLLLVDHQEPEIVEADVVAEEPVGPDDDVDRTGSAIRQRRSWPLGT